MISRFVAENILRCLLPKILISVGAARRRHRLIILHRKN
ncbi:hypothetical protein GXM_07748 [Nostoc sphaeroides CCNUC1]|uniref:Uncharacterized protein n=1 Tax=Nostoc sphaeroides CCNUC1 TaxID=2653204 RepID=A0A5P8WCA0_9NOSO|nr:hypothetical protein GXM_07748 [Nostoc sphaeroides CCNUC1]